jgi:hypothetical protein
MRLDTTLAAGLLTFALASPVAAQDKPFGITVGYPVSVGMLWQVHERLAVRPVFTFGYSNEGNDDSASTATSWRFGIATSAVVSIVRDGPRHLYAGPYYEFQRRNTTLSQAISYGDPDDVFATVNFTNIEAKPRSNEHSIGGLVGFEIRLQDRYGVFAEGGAAYRHSKRSGEMPPLPENSSSVAFSEETLNRTVNDVRGLGRVGVNIYF